MLFNLPVSSFKAWNPHVQYTGVWEGEGKGKGGLIYSRSTLPPGNGGTPVGSSLPVLIHIHTTWQIIHTKSKWNFVARSMHRDLTIHLLFEVRECCQKYSITAWWWVQIQLIKTENVKIEFIHWILFSNTVRYLCHIKITLNF